MPDAGFRIDPGAARLRPTGLRRAQTRDTAMPMLAPESRSAYVSMCRAVDALLTGSEPIRVRLRAAAESFREVDPKVDLATELERNLWHRIASSLVSGGPESEDDDDSPEALAASIDALDDDIAVLIARDMLRLYELAADRPDHSLRGTSQRWPEDKREQAHI
jgi:hypothetical protein